MPAITSYVVQYTNVVFSALWSSTFDLIITEGAPLPRAGSAPQLTDAQVAQLQAQGRVVAGYVNVSVTDTARSYWNAAWTDNGDDLGNLTGGAPNWLQGQPSNIFGRIVKFWEPAWQQIVINQAVDLVNRGYRAIFLDDVAQYFVAENLANPSRIGELAVFMAEFVKTIADAVRQINPSVIVIVNSDPYLVTNVTNDARGSSAVTAFLNAVDFHLLENQSTTAVEYAQTVMPNEPLLLLDTRATPAYTINDAWSHGIPYYTTGYDTLSVFRYRATEGADTLNGGDGPNRIDGLGGNDIIYGQSGDDVITGGAGADSLFGGAGNDVIFADPSDLLIDGGSGTDRVSFSVSGSLAGSLVNIEALELNGGAGLTLTGSQFANGLASNTAVSGSGALTVNMDSGIFFLSQNFAFSGSGITVTVNGTSDTDIIKCGTGIHIINAGDGVDQIRGGTAADIINGGAGNDKIIGFSGADTITGGTGSDQFRYLLTSDSGFGAAADRITDFTIGSDLLNFAFFDADVATAGDQAFNFIGTGAFAATGIGQIRYVTSGADLLVQADVNGDGIADMEIVLQGIGGGTLTAADFIL